MDKKGKFNYKNLNIFFVISFFLIIITVFCINYKADPYNIFNNKSNSGYYLNRDSLYIEMKAHNVKKDTLIIGSSELHYMFCHQLEHRYYFNLISLPFMTMKEVYEITNNYLELHPETKNIYLFLPYPGTLSPMKLKIPQYSKKSLSFNEIKFLFFSKHTTLLSLKQIKENIQKSKEDDNIFNSDNIKPYKYMIHNGLEIKGKDIYWKFSPTALPKYEGNQEDFKERYDEAIYYMNKFIDLMEERGINYEIAIPPYSAFILSQIHKNKDTRMFIENLKRNIVNRNVNIYDFGVVNKYTATSTIDRSWLYYNPDHPNYIFGIKIFKTFFDEENAEPNIYILINKNNIDSVLKKENELLENYIKNNQKTFDFYNEVEQHATRENQIIRTLNLKDLPLEYKKEIEYMNNKMELCETNVTRNKELYEQ